MWNQVEEALKRKLDDAGIDRGNTFKWEAAMQAGVLEASEISRLTELRMIRNLQVHSSTVDRKKVEYAVNLAEDALSSLVKGS